MLYYAIFVAFLIKVQASGDSPNIIIIGAGPSGIAAASRLLENGFNNITILEAENRIGGRVYTTRFGGYWVDLGGQWVHGEDDNASYELAWPLGVIEHNSGRGTVEFFGSSGTTINNDTAYELMECYGNIMMMDIPEEYSNESIGQFFELKLNEYFDTRNPDIPKTVRNSLIETINFLEMAEDAADTWLDVTVNPEEVKCEGDQGMNWLNRGYGTILDILMKKYPIPNEELPVINKTLFDTEVSKIHYGHYGVRVMTEKGDAYSADHVIVTTSLGVLKADYKTLFDPPLPEAKINAIKDIEFGSVAKIYLVYSLPWWTVTNGSFLMNLYWAEEDKKEYSNDPEKSWMLGIVAVAGVEHKQRLLCCWLTGPHAREMEGRSENQVFERIKELFHRFFGRSYNLTEPDAMLRTRWFSNKHFRGTWSYRSVKSKDAGATALDLEAPIMRNGNPVVMFAGEATHTKHPSTVHGAIASGWREADRLMELYPDRKVLPKISQWGGQYWQLFNNEKVALKRRLASGRWQTDAN